jgi:hypothetical protein
MYCQCHGQVRTGTYRYVPVRTILPDLVQVYRIPDVNTRYWNIQLKDDNIEWIRVPCS